MVNGPRDPNIVTGGATVTAPTSWTSLGFLKGIYNRLVSGTAGVPAGGVSTVQGDPDMVPIRTIAVDPTTEDPIDPTLPAEVTPGNPSDGWRYAAPTGGIDGTTTAVTIKAAVVDSVNYVTKMQISHATLGNATELAIRNGAGGTVLWRILLHTTAMPINEVTFDPPLMSSTNTLLEVVTLTSATGDVLVNFQGFTR